MPEGIPQNLLNKAECVIVFPSVKKFAIGVGGSYGRGVITCRSGANFTGSFSAPAMFALEGGNIGFQLGGQATDFVLLVMNEKGANSVMSSKVKLGADAAAAAGPKGRDAAAATDIVMNAEILSYSRSKGLFAGISLEGSTLRSDGGANENLYGKKLSAKEIVREGKVPMPADARPLISLLNTKIPKHAK
jgi:lipid-binding SYLF domain-containing protein